VWVLWWTKSYWDRLLSESFRLSTSATLNQCSILFFSSACCCHWSDKRIWPGDFSKSSAVTEIGECWIEKCSVPPGKCHSIWPRPLQNRAFHHSLVTLPLMPCNELVTTCEMPFEGRLCYLTDVSLLSGWSWHSVRVARSWWPTLSLWKRLVCILKCHVTSGCCLRASVQPLVRSTHEESALCCDVVWWVERYC
jgi:hypothetical protein